MANDRAKTIPEFLSDHPVTAPLARDILIIEDVPESGNSVTGGVTLGNLLGNTAVTGLSNGSYYYISASNTTTVTLSATPGGANLEGFIRVIIGE